MSDHLKSLLSDIVSHTHNLGILNLVKVDSDATSTKVSAMSDDQTVIMFGVTNQPYPELNGSFAMTQLNKLKYLVDGAEYQADAKINVVEDTRNGVVVPIGIHFENKDGDFKNDYRFMSYEILSDKLKNIKFLGATWTVEVNPTLQAIQRFQFQAGANTEHSTFVTKTQNGNLKFIFGDQGSHGGEFVFATGITGTLSGNFKWPVNSILNILKIADVNNCQLSISNNGALQITMDSGVAVYQYIIPALV